MVSVPSRGLSISNKTGGRKMKKVEDSFRPLSGPIYFKCSFDDFDNFGIESFRPLSGPIYFK